MAATSKSSRSSPSPEPFSNPHSTSARERLNTSSSRNGSPSSPSYLIASRPESSFVTGPTTAYRPGHLSNPSVSSQRSSGFLAFFDRTLAGITEPRLRPRQSLSPISIGSDSFVSGQPSPERGLRSARPASNYAAPLASPPVDGKQLSPALLLGDPPSQPYSETDPSQPEPTIVSRPDNKMHQTSSRLLRMTDDDRPFTRVSAFAH